MIPIDDGWAMMTIGRRWAFHVSSGKSLDQATYPCIPARAWSDDRVDSGPRDRRLAIKADWIRRLRFVHVACKGKAPRDFNPTRRKTK